MYIDIFLKSHEEILFINLYLLLCWELKGARYYGDMVHKKKAEFDVCGLLIVKQMLNGSKFTFKCHV